MAVGRRCGDPSGGRALPLGGATRRQRCPAGRRLPATSPSMRTRGPAATRWSARAVG